MREKAYHQLQESSNRVHEIYHLHVVQRLAVREIADKLCISRRGVYRALRTFEAENPELSEQMKKESKETTSEEYLQLQSELIELRKELARERLRGDFYEEMVAYGKEVYGIDLKKAGTR